MYHAFLSTWIEQNFPDLSVASIFLINPQYLVGLMNVYNEAASNSCNWSRGMEDEDEEANDIMVEMSASRWSYKIDKC